MVLALSLVWTFALVLGIAAVVGLVVVASGRARARRVAAWREVARRHGLDYAEARAAAGPHSGLEVRGPSLPRLEGVVNGRPIAVRAVPRGSDPDVLGATELVVEIGLRGPLPAGLHVAKGGPAIDELRRRIGSSDATAPQPAEVPPRVALDDKELERVLTVSACDADAARAWLDARRRRALLELMRLPHAHGAGIRDGKLFVHERRLGAAADELDRHLRDLLALAATLDREPSRPVQVGA